MGIVRGDTLLALGPQHGKHEDLKDAPGPQQLAEFAATSPGDPPL